jgi:hypothetical protein
MVFSFVAIYYTHPQDGGPEIEDRNNPIHCEEGAELLTWQSYGPISSTFKANPLFYTFMGLPRRLTIFGSSQ